MRFQKLLKGFDEFYFKKYRSALYKEANLNDDFFMILVFSEIYGIPNFMALQTLDMLPVLMPKFHEWHQKSGIEHSFFNNMPCYACCC
ncbi:MAG: cory-CC-star protein [Alcaligenaceae bacterium]|nr:cory-CC-star protein [Alcaligenaceae bacterium]